MSSQRGPQDIDVVPIRSLLCLQSFFVYCSSWVSELLLGMNQGRNPRVRYPNISISLTDEIVFPWFMVRYQYVLFYKVLLVQADPVKKGTFLLYSRLEVSVLLGCESMVCSKLESTSKNHFELIDRVLCACAFQYSVFNKY